MDDLPGNTECWTRIPISRIEDLRDAVLDAGLEATQMSTNTLTGSLVFIQRRGAIYSSGSLGATVALKGPLSQDKITLGIGLRFMPGTWHWMGEARTGACGLFMPCDEHDARYTPGALYATVTLDADQLEEEAAHHELMLDRKALGGTGIHPRHVPEEVVDRLRHQFDLIHGGRATSEFAGAMVCESLLEACITHFGRQPFCPRRKASLSAHARIVRLARAYVLEHLSEPICLDAIAVASHASRRTLYRAFEEILNDTPQHFVRRLRLHRIRQDLASDAERACTISMVANQWGISELGRMSAWYRELFGEHPSETLAQARKMATNA